MEGGWGFHYPVALVERFFLAWRASQYQLTLTGSWLDDPEDFWDDVNLYGLLFAREEAVIKAERKQKQ